MKASVFRKRREENVRSGLVLIYISVITFFISVFRQEFGQNIEFCYHLEINKNNNKTHKPNGDPSYDPCSQPKLNTFWPTRDVISYLTVNNGTLNLWYDVKPLASIYHDRNNNIQSSKKNSIYVCVPICIVSYSF